MIYASLYLPIHLETVSLFQEHFYYGFLFLRKFYATKLEIREE